MLPFFNFVAMVCEALLRFCRFEHEKSSKARKIITFQKNQSVSNWASLWHKVRRVLKTPQYFLHDHLPQLFCRRRTSNSTETCPSCAKFVSSASAQMVN